MNEQPEFGFVGALGTTPARPSQFPFNPQDAFSVYARRKGQKWLRVQAARALKRNARSQSGAGHEANPN